MTSEAGAAAAAAGQSVSCDRNAEVIGNVECAGATREMDTSSGTAPGRVHGSSGGRTPDSGNTDRPSVSIRTSGSGAVKTTPSRANSTFREAAGAPFSFPRARAVIRRSKSSVSSSSFGPIKSCNFVSVKQSLRFLQKLRSLSPLPATPAGMNHHLWQLF